ncbi:unnamed protein product [Arabis nemorensis]|uniref:Uncharacterized protein n=1 Tax=Arabis nemorensis TaxID=586526 RepID=A0A565AYF9_9BRAS|nr:unnamed protein product [Arabis nemorensis]
MDLSSLFSGFVEFIAPLGTIHVNDKQFGECTMLHLKKDLMFIYASLPRAPDVRFPVVCACFFTCFPSLKILEHWMLSSLGYIWLVDMLRHGLICLDDYRQNHTCGVDIKCLDLAAVHMTYVIDLPVLCHVAARVPQSRSRVTTHMRRMQRICHFSAVVQFAMLQLILELGHLVFQFRFYAQLVSRECNMYCLLLTYPPWMVTRLRVLFCSSQERAFEVFLYVHKLWFAASVLHLVVEQTFLQRQIRMLLTRSGWYMSILDFLYCSLPRPPEDLYEFNFTLLQFILCSSCPRCKGLHLQGGIRYVNVVYTLAFGLVNRRLYRID